MSIGKELRTVERFCEISSPDWWDLFHRVIPSEVMDRILDDTGAREQRARKITARSAMMLAIGMNIFTEESIEQAFAGMTEGIRFLHPELDEQLPKKGLCVRRATGWVPLLLWNCSVVSAGLSLQKRLQAPSCSV